MLDLEIFAGAGGMTLGLQRAGFRFSHVFEVDQHTCTTLISNSVAKDGVLHGEIHQEDVSKLDWSNFSAPIRLLAGGAPCQPFSLGGRHLADQDDRDMFPEVLRAVRSLSPQAVMLENVRGLVRPSFRTYFEYILRQLRWPSLSPRKGEYWKEHHERLCQHDRNAKERPDYNVGWKLIEAADFGVPQNRKRVFIVATRTDVLNKFEFPAPTHLREELIEAQRDGTYWSKHGIERREKNAEDARSCGNSAQSAAWKTVRDSISDLPRPADKETDSRNNHWLIPGARVYRGHTGSRLDWPSKTIKAGVHGVPGGENILLLDDESYRYFTLRETARLQGFPDKFIFHGARIHVTRQIGNAVPVDLAETIGKKLFAQIANDATKDEGNKPMPSQQEENQQ